MVSPWVSNKAAEDVDDGFSKNSARCRRFRWLLKFVVFPPLASTIFLHKRQMASPEFRGCPLSSAFRPKYIHTMDLLLGFAIRSMLPRSCLTRRFATCSTDHNNRWNPCLALLLLFLTFFFCCRRRSLLFFFYDLFLTCIFLVHYCHPLKNKQNPV